MNPTFHIEWMQIIMSQGTPLCERRTQSHASTEALDHGPLIVFLSKVCTVRSEVHEHTRRQT